MVIKMKEKLAEDGLGGTGGDEEANNETADGCEDGN